MDLVRDLVPVPQEIDRGEGWSVFSFLEGELLHRVPEHSAAAARALVDADRGASGRTLAAIAHLLPSESAPRAVPSRGLRAVQ